MKTTNGVPTSNNIGRFNRSAPGDRQRRFPFFYAALFILLLLPHALLPSSALAVDDWKKAAGDRLWRFPRDYGSHPEYRTEWWYFTGNLSDAAGAHHGFQLTFFRRGIRRELPKPSGPWDVRDVYLGHFALSDTTRQKFSYAERISRSGPGLASASQNNLDVRLLGWTARMDMDAINLRARHDGMELDLALASRKLPILHGINGLSRKGPGVGQASYYASLTHLDTEGFLKTPSSARIAVKGRSWFDQEFGSNQLSADQVGWDWFGIYISDGRELMVYLLRRKDGSLEPASSGTLVEADGSKRHLKLSEISVKVLKSWKSPRSGGEYPGQWEIKVPSAGIKITISPHVEDQELSTAGSTGVTYWEGALSGRGTSRDRSVTCQGYAELTGYAGSLGALF